MGGKLCGRVIQSNRVVKNSAAGVVVDFCWSVDADIEVDMKVACHGLSHSRCLVLGREACGGYCWAVSTGDRNES